MRAVFNSKKIPYGKAIFMASLALVLMPTHQPVKSEEAISTSAKFFPDELITSYDLYWKGLRVVTADSHLKTTPTTFNHNMTWRTRGVLRWFVKGKTNASSSGRFADDFTPQADTYSSDGKWGKRLFERTVNFAPDGKGTVMSITDPWGEENDREPMPEGLDVGPDPVTMALFLLKAPIELSDNEESLNFTSYDGIRSMAYDVSCSEILKPLRKTGHSPFRGLSRECNVKARQTGGFSKAPREKEERDPREDHGMSILIQKLEGENIYVPVQGTFKSKDGTLKLYLTKTNIPVYPFETTEP